MVNNLSIDPGENSKALSFIHDFLEENKLSDKDKTRALLLTEETLIKLSEHAAPDSRIKILTRKLFGNTYIDITSRGDDFELINGMNPTHFYRKYAPTMLQVFSLSSSNAAIPLNMKACTEQLGISPRIASFSIPLGATINMNGACVQLAVSALAIARIYNVSISGRLLVIMCVTIIVLSMGAPGIPGMGIILLTVILTQFNVPVEGVSLIIGIYPILDMFITVVNCLGDVVTSFIVAKSEKLLDRKVFEAK